MNKYLNLSEKHVFSFTYMPFYSVYDMVAAGKTTIKSNLFRWNGSVWWRSQWLKYAPQGDGVCARRSGGSSLWPKYLGAGASTLWRRLRWAYVPNRTRVRMTLKTLGKADIWWVSYHFSSTRAPITSNTLHKFITTMYTGVSNMQNRCMNVVTISRKKNTYELSLRTVHALTRVWTVSQSNTRFLCF